MMPARAWVTRAGALLSRDTTTTTRRGVKVPVNGPGK